MRIIKAVMTSNACPSQWDAWTDEGDYVYLRYRHGYGYAKVYENENWWNGGNNAGTQVASFEYGDDLDGFITLQDFCEKANLELDLE